MKLALNFAALMAVLALSACGGKGSQAPAPTGLSVAGEDGQITLNWTAVPGVQYRAYCAPGASVDNVSWYTTFGGVARAGALDLVLPPFTVDSLQNGTGYACTVDGRYDNGPAGPSAPSLQAQPQSAGLNWAALADTGLGAGLGDVTAGVLTNASTDRYFAVGAGARVRVADSATSGWSDLSLPSTVSSVVGDLKTAVVFGGRLYIAGTGGVVAYSSDLVNWSTVNLGGPVRKIVNNTTRMVAVGPAGLLRTSTDGSGWATPSVSSPVTQELRGVAYSEAGYWVAVGAGGTVLLSANADAGSWSAVTGPSQALQSVAALKVQTPNTSNYEYRLVAVGDAGTVGYSTDGQNWSWQSAFGGANLSHVAAGNQILVQLDKANAKTYAYAGGQFMAAGPGGKVFRTGDALAWSWNAAPWEDISNRTGVSTSPVVLWRYGKVVRNSAGQVSAYAWLLYGNDGTGRTAR